VGQPLCFLGERSNGHWAHDKTGMKMHWRLERPLQTAPVMKLIELPSPKPTLISTAIGKQWGFDFGGRGRATIAGVDGNDF